MSSPALLSAFLGALFFGWIASLRILNPTETGWVMQGDWQWHFLGWHLFRNEPWRLPPGIITSYLEPMGSALGYTDSIPLVAFLLKPVESWLPNPFQYLGLWFLLCFALQGFFGSLLIRTWTTRGAPQVIGGCLLVLAPTLLARIAHPALSSHWLLLWALWLNWRKSDSHGREEVIQHAALGLTSGLVHPYLAVMVWLLLVALVLQRGLTDRRTWLFALLPFSVAMTTVSVGWWASGLFTVTSIADLQSGGLGDFSMNLLGPVTAAGRSVFLPDLPIVTQEQIGEGFQYLGVGVLFVCAIAAALCLARRCRWTLRATPLGVVLVVCALYAVSPRVTLGSSIFIDLVDRVGTVSMFRSTGRFFWPVGYALPAASIGLVAVSFKPRIAAMLLSCALVLQVVDLHRWFLTVHDGARNPAFFVWTTVMASPEWGALLPNYEHIRLYSPSFCHGPQPVPLADAASLAGRYGLGINDGFAARVDSAIQANECARLRHEFAAGVVDDLTVYLVAPVFLPAFEQRAGASIACRRIDGVPVCVSKQSLPRGAS